MKIKVANG
jgi:hypothetical protein